MLFIDQKAHPPEKIAIADEIISGMHLHRTLAFITYFGVIRGADLNVRLSFGHGSGLGISWQVPAGEDCSTVQYGTERERLDQLIQSQKYCSLYKGDTFHHVFLSDLWHDSVYFYSVECSLEIGSFRTAPKPGRSKSFTMAVFADLGTVNGESTLSALHDIHDEIAGHIFAGDIGYADDAFMHGQTYIKRTNEFLKAFSNSTKSVPVMVAPGNHEAEDHTPVCLLSPRCRAGFGNFTAYNCIWDMPSEGRRHSMWSSFNYGPVHFVMTNTETDYSGAPLEPYGEVGFIPTGRFGQPGEYEKWLEADLSTAENERDIRPWIIVVGHRPITVLDDKSDPFKTPLNQNIIDLISRHADAYVSGHVHYYARSIPKPASPFRAISITVGGAGCDEWTERRIQDTRSGETEFAEYFGYGDEQTFGKLSFDIQRPDELIFELIRSRDRKLIDRIVIPARRQLSTESVVIASQ